MLALERETGCARSNMVHLYMFLGGAKRSGARARWETPASAMRHRAASSEEGTRLPFVIYLRLRGEGVALTDAKMTYQRITDR